LINKKKKKNQKSTKETSTSANGIAIDHQACYLVDTTKNPTVFFSFPFFFFSFLISFYLLLYNLFIYFFK